MESDRPASVRIELRLDPAQARALSERARRGIDLAGLFRRLMLAAGPGDYRLALVVLAGLLAGLFVLVNVHGPCFQVVYGHDDIGFLNAAWKVRNGLLPHTGYHSALGALNPWIFAAAMWVLGPTAAVLPVCIVTVAVGLGVLAWTVARRRLPAFPALGFALTQTLVAEAAHLMRFPYYAATYDGYYNRQSFVLVSILLLVLFLPRRAEDDPERGQRVDGRIVGGIIGVLVFLKVSYAAVAVGLCMWAMLSGRRFSREWWTNAMLAGGAVCAACLPLIGFNVAAMLRDLHMAAGARSADPHAAFSLANLFGELPIVWVEIALLAVAQLALRPAWWFRQAAAGEEAPADVPPTWLEFAGLVGACMVIYMTNAPGGDHSDDPLLATWGFVLLGCALRRAGSRRVSADGAAGLPVLCGVLAILWVYAFGTALQSFCWSNSPWLTNFQETAYADTTRFDAHPLEDLFIGGFGGEAPMPVSYSEKVNDGLRLLRKVGGVHRVAALDFVNPFPFALGWPPVRGEMWCWHMGYSFSDTAHPSADEAFGDADVLMLPKYPGEHDSFTLLMRVYGGYFKSHFRVKATSEQWYLLTRS